MASLQKDSKFLKGRKSQALPGYFNSQGNTLEGILATLEVPRRSRNSCQINQLASFTKDIKLFREMSEELNYEAHYQCCECLSAHYCEARKFVFHEGDPGDKFYVILSGSCSVIVTVQRIDGKTEQKQIAVLRQGEGFGELALISNQPRIASILCREDSYFATLSRDDYTRILSKVQCGLMETKIEILNRQKIFKHLSKSALQRLSYFFKILRLKRKQKVFEAGEDSTHLYLVKEGEFQLTQEVDMNVNHSVTLSSPKSTKVRVGVTLITVGEFIGSEEVVARRAYRYTCSCHSTEGELMAISKKDFFRMLGNEETLMYFSALGKVREEYRQERVMTVKKVEKEKRTLLLSPSATMRDVSLTQDHSPHSFTKRSSDLSTSSLHSYSFSSRLFSPSSDPSSLRAMLQSTSGKRMIIRTQSDKEVPKRGSILRTGHRSSVLKKKLKGLKQIAEMSTGWGKKDESPL